MPLSAPLQSWVRVVNASAFSWEVMGQDRVMEGGRISCSKPKCLYAYGGHHQSFLIVPLQESSDGACSMIQQQLRSLRQCWCCSAALVSQFFFTPWQFVTFDGPMLCLEPS